MFHQTSLQASPPQPLLLCFCLLACDRVVPFNSSNMSHSIWHLFISRPGPYSFCQWWQWKADWCPSSAESLLGIHNYVINNQLSLWQTRALFTLLFFNPVPTAPCQTLGNIATYKLYIYIYMYIYIYIYSKKNEC